MLSNTHETSNQMKIFVDVLCSHSELKELGDDDYNWKIKNNQQNESHRAKRDLVVVDI